MQQLHHQKLLHHQRQCLLHCYQELLEILIPSHLILTAYQDKAIVKEVEIDCSNASVIGGKGAILAKSLTITSPSGETHTVSWGKGNVTITNLFIAEKAAGTWSVYMTGTNADVLYAKYEYLSKCKQ